MRLPLRDKLLNWLISGYDRQFVKSLVARMLEREGIQMFRFLDDHCLAFYPRDFVGQRIAQNGQWQRQMLNDAIAKIESERGSLNGRIFVDVGANIGTHTVYASLLKRFSGFVCLEPDPRTFPLLQANVAANGLDSVTRTVNIAAGSIDGNLEMVAPVGNYGATRIVLSADPGADVKRFLVPVRRLDDVLLELKIPAGDIGLVWMDVEGYELEVLKGMPDLLASLPSICFEFSPDVHPPGTGREIADLIFAKFDKVFVFENGNFRSTTPDAIVSRELQCDILALSEPQIAKA